jgi:hypothetical protein
MASKTALEMWEGMAEPLTSPGWMRYSSVAVTVI